jgi:plasmid replication initiation protein
MMLPEVRTMKEDTKYLELRNATVVKANDMIQKSRFNLTLQQQKIILYLISQIEPGDKEFQTYEFSITEFCRVCGIDISGKNYNDLKENIKEISCKALWVTMPNGDESLLRWIEKAKIINAGGLIQIRLDDDLKPFLLQLKENFTKYELVYTLHFKSKYTIRLYELIKSIHYHELQEYRRRFDVDELRRILGAETYPIYKNFKQRVLSPTIEEINKYSDKTLAIEEIKQGRKIVAIELIVGSKDSLETMRIRDGIDKEMGMLPGQTSIYDEMVEKGIVSP